jgi:hypothetical protein
MKGEFHYRRNADGTFDSIRLRCYLTAGSAGKEEPSHQSNPKWYSEHLEQ